MLKRFAIFALLVALAAPAAAQQGVLKRTTLDVAEETSAIRLDGLQSVGVSVINSGTYTLAFEASADGGTTWVSVGLVDLSDFTRDTSTTAAGTWAFGNLGFSHFRVRASAYTSGAPVVSFSRGYGGVNAPLSAGSISGGNDAASATGAAVPSSASYTGVNIGGNLTGLTGFSLGSTRAGAFAIVDGSGNQITSFGGGTQYTEADTDASITGTAVMFESNTGTNALSVVSNSAPLPVSDAGGALTVDGTVTVTDGAGALNVICDSGCGSGAQYAEDAAHTTGDQTIFVSGIRRDTTPSSSAGTAGDYTALNIDGNGRLYVQAVLYNSSGTELSIASDGTVGSAIGTTAPMGTAVYADFDGAAIPTIANVDTEGELVPIAASVKGVQYMMLVSEDGAVTPLAVEDAAETPGGGLMMAGAVVRSSAAGSSATAGDNATLNVDTLGRVWTRNGNLCADHARLSTAAINTSSSGNVELVALNGSDLIYVCGYSVVAGAATGVQFIYGTGTACATGETDLTGVWSFAANGGITNGNAGVPQFVVPAGNAFCLKNSGANSVQGHIVYVRTAAP